MAQTVDQVCQEICALLEPYNVNGLDLAANTDLAADLNMDSVAAMDLLMEVEEKFDVDIPINMLSEVSSPQDLANIVAQQLEKS